MTSLLSKIEHFLSGSGAEHFVVTLGKDSLKVASTSPFGAAILDAIKAGEAGTTTVQKIELGIASLAPFILSEATKGGVVAIESDAETTARIAIESVLPQVKAAVTAPLAILNALEAVAKGV